MKKKDINLIRKIFDLKVIPNLLQYMKMESISPYLVLESTWSVVNLTVGDENQIEFMVKRGILDIVLNQLQSNYDEIIEQAVWVIGNLAAESIDMKCSMLKMGFAEILTEKIVKNNFEKKKNLHFIWALSNLCRGTLIHKSQIHSISAFMKILILFHDEEEAVSHCIHPINDLINKDILEELILNTKFLEILLLICIKNNENEKIQEPIIQIICTISCMESNYVKNLVKYKFDDILFLWLTQETIKSSIKKEILYTLSNFMVDSDELIGAVLKSQKQYDILISFCYNNKELALKREAIWCICNITKVGSNTRKKGLIENGILKMFSENLEMQEDSQILLIILEGLENLLEFSFSELQDLNSKNKFMILLNNINIFEKLEKLQMHKNSKVYHRVVNLCEEYFDLEKKSEYDILHLFKRRNKL